LVKRVAVITSASGNGGTRFARELAAQLLVPFYELDALFWRPDWTETPAEEFRALMEPIVATEAWVIDGSYQSKLGDLVLRNADLVVWLDLPMYVWLPRLLRRTVRRIVRREQLWTGNRETVRGAFFSRKSLIYFTLRWYRPRRRRHPERLAPFRSIRLRSRAEVDRVLSSASRET
jgi:adenylate kinase family enzyme